MHNFEILDDEGVKFSNSTPMKYVLDKEFIMCINDYHYTSVLNFTNTNEGLVNIDESIPLDVNKNDLRIIFLVLGSLVNLWKNGA